MSRREVRAAIRASLAALLVWTGLPERSAGAATAVPEALPGAPAFSAALRAQLGAALEGQGTAYVPRTRHRKPDGAPVYTNRLLLEASPYLQQHAHNPVNWYPWGDEAFAVARALGRPVLVSIGYSTCHWCHVMEEESFDDAEVAAFLNAHFVAIKVDRELRPDVDSIYMSALHALQGRGGWPLNAFVTWERKPFYAGSYFPREEFLELLRAIQGQHAEDPARMTEFAGRLGEALKAALESARASANVELAPETLHAAVQGAAAGFDREYGGLGAQPKFPQRTPVRLLLRYHRRTGNADALGMATKTLDALARGGIHDQIGGGFHRYATDRRWLIPHFEKMLYTQAQLVLAYTEAWQVTKREDFAAVVDRTLAYVEREMRAPNGGFYSATDADSAGPGGEREEGAFFTWTPAEVRAVLDARDAKAALAYWGIGEEGNFEGRSIPHAPRTLAAVALELRSTEDDLARRLERARAALYAERQARPPPLRDDKILAGWNGLMISAFARAGFAFANAGYTRAAARAADFALTQMKRNGQLQRAWRDGRVEGSAFLEDHAFLIAGLLDLYEASPDPRWLREAAALQASQDARFADEAGGGYYRTAVDHELLLAREKPWQDGSVPSGNSVAALNLLRLYAFTGEPAYSSRAGMLFSALHELMTRDPLAMSELLLAADFQLDLPKEVVVVKPEGDAEAPELLVPLRRVYAPNRIVSIVREGPELAAHAELVPLVREKRAREGKTTVYVCENRVCDLPTSDPATVTRLLRRTKQLGP